MQKIRERINKRAGLIANMQKLQRIDLNAIGKREPILLTNEKVLKGVLKCCRRDFESVFWRHKASGKVNQHAPNVKIRQMYFYICKKLVHSSFKETGKVTNGGKLYQVYDHSNVIHAVRAHENLIEFYKAEKKFSDSVVQYLKM